MSISRCETVRGGVKRWRIKGNISLKCLSQLLYNQNPPLMNVTERHSTSDSIYSRSCRCESRWVNASDCSVTPQACMDAFESHFSSLSSFWIVTHPSCVGVRWPFECRRWGSFVKPHGHLQDKRMKYVEGKRNICVCCVFSANNIHVYITIPLSYNHFLSRQHRALPHCVPDHTRSTVFSFFSPPSCLSPSRVTSPTVRSFSPL